MKKSKMRIFYYFILFYLFLQFGESETNQSYAGKSHAMKKARVRK
jgi:hypothetical protein